MIELDRFAWGEVATLDVGTLASWQLGPLRLWARRDPREWTLSYVRDQASLDTTTTVEIPSRTEPEGDLTVRRFGFGSSPAEIRLEPAMANRPVVVTPEEPFLLPPQESTTLYVSIPVWVRVAVGVPPVGLVEEPSYRPSDTWFGESTRSGVLCYATRTRATIELDELPVCAHRARSVVRIRNLAATVLEVEKVKLPAPNMALYVTAGGHLWTEVVSFTREQDGIVASVVLEAGPPSAAGRAELVAPPRLKLGRGFLDRTFSGIIRELRG